MTQPVSDGGVKTLWRVSLPLILSFLSMLAMMTVDRMFLANYSAAALSAAASAGTTAWAFTFGGQTLTNISGVFVAQYNGAKRFSKIGKPVWQMIWVSLFMVLPMAAAGLWLAPVAFRGSPIESLQIEYFRWMMVISPLFCLVGALNGFFIGRGSTQTITWLTLIGNTINLVLDPILIFGWKGIPSLGMAGACIATGIGLSAQIVIMLFLFLKDEHKQAFGTAEYRLDWTLLKDLVRVGSPEAIAISLEIAAWGAFYLLLSDLSALHILVASVGQSILLLFFWFGVGLEQGVASVCGNLIGANKKDEVPRLLNSGLKINLFFLAGLVVVLYLVGDSIINAFLQNPETLEGAEHLGGIQVGDLALARSYLRHSLYVVGAYVVIENVRNMLFGVLRASGDTFFLLVTSVFSTWALLLTPTYILMTLWRSPVSTCFAIWIGFASLTTLICYTRFRVGSWRHKSLTTAHA